jgi:alpha-tubulin suppressor-like RCC1 family protein
MIRHLLIYSWPAIGKQPLANGQWLVTSLLTFALALLLPPLAYGQRLASSQAGFTATILPDGTLWAWGSAVGGLPFDKVLTPTQVSPGTTWRSVATGANTVLAVRQDGTLWGWGNNGRGQLGIAGLASSAVPVQIGTATTWQSVAGGQQHAVAIRTDGTLWAWGDNQYGQLGTGTSTTAIQATPRQIGTATNWQQVVANADHTLALRTDGTLWAWGDNVHRALGLGYAAQQETPSQVSSASTWQSISTGDRHTLAVRADGTLWAWGDNTLGQLGDGTLYARTFPVQVGTAATWRSVAAGYDHSLGLRADGSLWAWGSNNSGQLGIPASVYAAQYQPTQVGTATTWREIAAGGAATLARQADNSVWTWGSNASGQTGSPALAVALQSAFKQLLAPVKWQQVTASFLQTSALGPDGTLWVWGRQNNVGGRQPVPLQLGTAAWQSVSSGFEHTVGVRADGTLWAWGRNNYGQLGYGGAAQYKELPVQVGTASTWRAVATGYYHTVAVHTDGTLWAWGINTKGELGDGTQLSRNAPMQVGTGTTWRSVAAGHHYSLAIQADGTLWAWGDNDANQLGTSARQLGPPTQVGTATDWQQVVAGEKHTLALRTDGTLWSWGNNRLGQLGLGNFIEQPVPTQVGTDKWQALATDRMHALAVRADGTLWGWGHNYALGDDAAPQLRPAPVQIGTATTWRSVAAGYVHSVALGTDGVAWVCGDNLAGQLGIPDFSAVPLLIFSGNVLATTPAPPATASLLPYPNPAHDYLQVPGLSPAAQLCLFDVLGRPVRSGTGARLPLLGLPTGLYLLQSTERGQPARQARVHIE